MGRNSSLGPSSCAGPDRAKGFYSDLWGEKDEKGELVSELGNKDIGVLVSRAKIGTNVLLRGPSIPNRVKSGF